MTKLSPVKQVTMTAICVALCYVLPMAFHAVGLGSALSPMHIPVLLCGLVCGGGYGLLCGLAGPVLSSLVSGMPPMAKLPFMACELMTYGLVAGALLKCIRTGKPKLDLYLALIGAMVAGRIVGGAANALYMNLLAGTETFTLAMWISSYFVTSFGGIVAHLILVPGLYAMLVKAKLIPNPKAM